MAHENVFHRYPASKEAPAFARAATPDARRADDPVAGEVVAPVPRGICYRENPGRVPRRGVELRFVAC
jgi:hypothetical protein